jgi:TRAP transporter TAXI family solute receptor
LGEQYCTGVGVYQSDNINDNTIAIISGSPNSDDTNLQIAYDLATVLNDGNRLRILPVAGIGGPQNIRDVRYLRGIDIGLTQTSVLNNFMSSNADLGNHDYDGKIVYIAKLFNEEAHVVARSDISSIDQLQGRKVSLDVNGSGTNTSMRDVFKRLGIKVDEVNVTQGDAVEKLRNGEIDAAVLIAGKPTRSMEHLKPEGGLHFVPIPYTAGLGADYLAASLSHDDYPDMIPPGQSVETIAVGAVLIAYNWPKNTDRYRRVEKFISAFFPRLADLQKPPGHVKWREVNLAAELQGWTRFEPAQAWLDANQKSATASDQRPKSDQASPDRGVQQVGGIPQQDDKLFQEYMQSRQEFMKWKRSREHN